MCTYAFVPLRRLSTPLKHCGRFVAVESRKSPVFSAYVKTYFNEVKSKYPIMKTTEIMKKLSEMYKTASPSELAKLTLDAPITRIKTEEERLEDRRKLLVLGSVTRCSREYIFFCGRFQNSIPNLSVTQACVLLTIMLFDQFNVVLSV